MARVFPLFFFILLALSPRDVQAQNANIALTFRPVLNADQTDADIENNCCNLQNKFKLGQKTSHIRTSFGGKAFWLKVEGVTGNGLILFNPVLDEVVLYTRSLGKSKWHTVRTGDTVANSKKPLATPFMALPLSDKVDTTSIYVRITQPTTVTVRATYWTLPPFIAMQESDRTIKTFLLGFVSSIVLYNIVVSFLVRDPAFLLNAFCISALLVFSLYLSGYGVAYIWETWYAYSNTIQTLSVAVGILSASAFFYFFLKTPENSKIHYWPIAVGPVLTIVSTVILGIFGAPYWLIQASVLACALVLFVCVIPFTLRAALTGEKKAQILLVPMIVAVLPGLVLLTLDKMGGITPFKLGNNTMELTLAAEAVFFSLAMAWRIRITETKNQLAVQKLLKLRARNSKIALSAQDSERKRLAKDLHDGVGQELLLTISLLKRLAGNAVPTHFPGAIEDLIQKTSRIMKNLRRISRDMHPASLEHLGLVGTIEDIVLQVNQARQIEVTHKLHIDGFEFNQEAQLHLVRIIQECISNTVKHSGASQCIVNMDVKDSKLRLRIEDDGIGISHQNIEEQRGFGLGMTSMGERVHSLSGEWEISQSTMGGLMTCVMIPMAFILVP